MANAETRRDEYTFLGKGCTIRTYLLWAATQLPLYQSIFPRSGRAVAHESRRSEGHSNGWAKAPKRSARTFVLPNLGRRSGVTDTHTDGQTDKSKSASPGQNLLNGNGVGPPLAGTTARDHQGSGVGCGWWTGDRTVRTLLLRHQTRTPVQRRGVRPLTQPTRRRQQPVVRARTRYYNAGG